MIYLIYSAISKTILDTKISIKTTCTSPKEPLEIVTSSLSNASFAIANFFAATIFSILLPSAKVYTPFTTGIPLGL